jgi:hypothetical protein
MAKSEEEFSTKIYARPGVGLCKICKNVQSRDYYTRNKERVRGYHRRYRAENPEKDRETHRKKHVKLRTKVLEAYGSYCACCGESDYHFLAIDHINGGGAAHRREIGGGGNTYNWLVKNNFPKGFQVLCHNCNQARGAYGFCPHENRQKAVNDA